MTTLNTPHDIFFYHNGHQVVSQRTRSVDLTAFSLTSVMHIARLMEILSVMSLLYASCPL